ncbi:MAG: hypothetical protein AAFX07_03985 [Pseudomonadota bacterium]
MTIETEWMMDVLDDIKSFCLLNGMQTTAEKIVEVCDEVKREKKAQTADPKHLDKRLN